MGRIYVYVISRDFGFAPNPFHGACTLATCKPRIRRVACQGDWVMGMGGGDLKATGRCIYAMQVTQTSTFDDYWSNPAFFDKRPVRNGSRRMMVGDNIYSRNRWTGLWEQADSHHSRPDGSPDANNVAHDTSVDRVLVSRRFVYFGRNAAEVPAELLEEVGYRNVRDYRVFGQGTCQPLLDWMTAACRRHPNQILGDPFQFRMSHARYSSRLDRVLA